MSRNNKRTVNTSRSKIFDYWKDKAIMADGTVIFDDFNDSNSIPVIYDHGSLAVGLAENSLKNLLMSNIMRNWQIIVQENCMTVRW